MKKNLLYLLLIISLTFTMKLASGQVLDVPLTTQEHSMWCWDASSVCVMNYYGYVFTQCEIANWAFTRSDCCNGPEFNWVIPDGTTTPPRHPCNEGNYLFGYTDHDVDDILLTYGSILSGGLESELSELTVAASITLGVPYFFRWDWTGGGAHALVGHGYDEGTVYYMDPWPGEGLLFGDYAWMVSGGSHSWTRSLVPLGAPVLYDFYVQEAAVDKSCVAPGAVINVSCSQCFAGSQSSADLGSVNLGYYLSEDASFDPSSDIYLGSDAAALGTNNRCSAESAALTIPQETANGLYYVLFVADPNDQFNLETNNTNNIAFISLQIDNIAPTLTCVPYTEISTDAGECTFTITGTEFDATATDNGVVEELGWVLSGATTGYGEYFLGGITLNFGINTVTWTAMDDCGNISTCEHIINLNKIIAVTEVTVDPSTQNYSDLVEFTATLEPGECTGAGKAATHVTFYVGSQPMGDPLPLTLDGNILTASETYALLDLPGYEGTMDPDPAENPKVVTAVFSGKDPDFQIANPITELTILPENACAIYAGVYYASTGSVLSDVATVVLAATIVEEDDGDAGDFFNTAFVQFLADDRVIATIPVVPITEVNGELPIGEIGAATAIGAASYEWDDVPIGVYDIRVKITGYYTNDPSGDCDGEAVVVVGKPSSDFISGGGYVILENPMGLSAGDIGTKNNFGFNVKYNRKLINLQGNINTIIRRTETDGLHIYRAKGNVLTSLTVNDKKAVFTGKCSLQDITDPDYPFDVTGGGGATLQFTMTDNGEPGFEDLISVTIWKKDGGLWFTTLWDNDAYLPVEQTLDGGNLVVKSAKEETTEKPPKIKSAEAATIGEYALKVYPNPFSDKLWFEFTAPSDVTSRLEIFDVTGRKMDILFEEKMKAGQFYRIEYTPKNQVTQMIIYRMVMGVRTINGKVMYRK